MPTIEIGLLLALIGGVVGVMTFFIGRQSEARKSGQDWGAFQAELKTDLKYIKRDVGEIKASMSKTQDDIMLAIAKESDARKDSIRRLHEKFDNHLVKHHNAPSTED